MRTERLAAAALLIAVAGSPAAAEGPVEAGRRLVFAVYKDNPPYSVAEQGIDADVARALAARLGVAAEVKEYPAADDVDGDLRNIVWRGHHLWRGRLADVMIHVPVDPNVIRKNDKVKIFAPYFRERIVLARSAARIPNLPTLQAFTGEKIGVQVETVEDRYLVTSFGGGLRENVVHFGSVADAAAALVRGEIPAIMGRESIIEAALGADAGKFVIAVPPAPGLAITGWELGLAVKADDVELATALERAMSALVADGTIQGIFARRGVAYRPPSPGSAGR